MTAHKHLKQLVRARMQKTGESYAAARRQVLRQAAPPAPQAPALAHLPGNVPAATALRILLRAAGVRAPHSGQPFSEAMLFGIAGGIGIGVFAFSYASEGVSTFFIAGRHAWHDDQLYLRAALATLGAQPLVQEAGGVKAAAAQLSAALGEGGPCVAWVDMAGLPHRAMPPAWSGGGYHLVTVYAVDAAAGEALIGDLADQPVPIPLADLAQARARIAKQRNRTLALPAAASPAELAPLVDAGLRACHAGLVEPLLRQAAANARLDALRTWAERMHGGGGKEAWERAFRPGPNLWRGLCAIYDFVEHYGTGGGLCRPIFADFLAEAGAALARPQLSALAAQYAELGQQWAELAAAALPADVPLLAEARARSAQRAELLHAGAPPEQIRAAWAELAELERRAGEDFPLSEAAAAELRAGLSARIMAIYQAERAAHAALGAALPA